MALIGLFGPVSTVLSGVASMFTTGAQQLCCCEMGNGNTQRLRRIFNLGALFLLGFGILCTVLMYAFGQELAVALGVGKELREGFVSYVAGISPGIVGQLLSCYLMPFLQINGKTRISYLAMAVNVMGNMVFNTLFVIILPWGLFGMGLATSLSGLLCMGVMVPVFCKKNELVHFDPCGLVAGDIAGIVRAGSPVLVFNAALFLKNYGMNWALLTGSTVEAVAVLNLQGSLCGILGALGFGSGTAVQMLSSFYVGEGDRKAIGSVFGIAIKTGMALCVPILLGILFFAMPIIRLFGLGDMATQVMALRMLRLLCVAIPLDIVLVVFVKLFQAAGKLVLANAVIFMENVLQAAFALIFVGIIGPDAAWAAFPVAALLCLLAVFAYCLSGGGCCRNDLAGFLHFPADFGGTDEARMTMTIQSLEDVMDTSRQIVDFCTTQGIANRACMAAGLCVEELAGNVVKHGFTDRENGQVWVLVLCKNGALTLRIRDNCVRFDPKEYLQLSSAGDPSEHIGIRLVAGMVDTVNYQNMFGMNMLTIEVTK